MIQTQNPTASATAAEAPKNRSRYQRRRYLIDPAMQGRYFLGMLLISGVAAFGAVLLASHYFHAVAGPGEAPDLAQRSRMLHLALGAGVLAAIVLPVVSIFLSHRIAGPAYRLRQAAARVAAGDLNCRIHLRRYDHLKPTAEAFNQMLAALEKQAGEAAAAREAIQAALGKFAAQDESEFPEAMRLLEEAAARLRAKV